MTILAITLKDHLAQFVVGARLEVVEHWVESQRNKTRTITKVQGNGYWYTDDDGKRCFGNFVKRREIEFNDDGSFTYFPGQQRAWRLRFIEEAIPCATCGRYDMPLHQNLQCPECRDESPDGIHTHPDMDK